MKKAAHLNRFSYVSKYLLHLYFSSSALDVSAWHPHLIVAVQLFNNSIAFSNSWFVVIIVNFKVLLFILFATAKLLKISELCKFLVIKNVKLFVKFCV